MTDIAIDPQTVSRNAVTAGATFGTAFAVFVVWYLNAFTWPGKVPAEVATAVGGMASTAVMTVWHLVSQFLKKRGYDSY